MGRKIDNINLHTLENRLKANPFIEYAKVYADMDGVIMIEISQRQPIMRVMNQFDQIFILIKTG
ncbi:cell division protein FtsQ/DivIB [Mucilaginibacter humi]|uniref:hypothetical protein n=1 Tax=Mucilaginibacter humi TaxID=2732510 RepID=UPI0015850C45|nr:hypothetical protein [Mucilaginibacter humi]